MSALKPSDLSVVWQGISEHTTQRGRVKPVLTGIPGQAFWYSYKHHAQFRAQLAAATITLRKLAKGSWEVVLWCNDRNAVLVADLGFSVPEVAVSDSQPQPF